MGQCSLGQRLREARIAAGLSTRELAQRLKEAGDAVSHVTISKYERDEFSPARDTLEAIATIVGKAPDWFEGTTAHLAGVRFRALKTLPQRDKDRFAIDATPWLRLYAHVVELVERKRPKALQLTARRNETGPALAKRVRDTYKLENYPIPSVSRMLELHGILVVQQAGMAGIDAFAGHFGEHRVVVVNRELSPDRMRLTLSHEFGHVLYDDCAHEHRIDPSDLETRAFEFGSHLLMPTAVLKQAFETRSMVRLVRYKEYFGISLAAMVYRAKQHRFVPDSMAQMLWREFSRLGWRRSEPGHVQADRPLRLEALLDAALRQKRATPTELSRISALTPEAIHSRIMDAMGAREARADNDAPTFRISAYLDEGHGTENVDE